MKRIFAVLTLFLALLSQAQTLPQSLYFVGELTNWDINSPIKIDLSDGVYRHYLDLTGKTKFKLSVTDPNGSWTTFDTGTLYPAGEVSEDVWIPIKYVATSGDIVAPASRAYVLKVDLANMRMMFSTGNQSGEPWSGTLPVLFISTENNTPVTSKETYLRATYYLDPMGVEGVEAVGTSASPLTLQIKGRGNYTWTGFEKKPYRLKLDNKAALLGMDNSKHFALLAHADDTAAGLRNALGFAVSESLGMPWTPATRPVELVLNGDYRGLYWLTETIRVDADRVDVVEQADEATTDVDGGWLVEIDNYNTDPHVTVFAADGSQIWFTYKSPEILSAEQNDYLLDQMQKINAAVEGGDQVSAAGLVDFDILARYFITNQIMLDMESFHGSCYLNRQRGQEQKWMFGPVWDFGNAFSPSRADAPRFIFDRPDFSQVWIGGFYKMPLFVEAVKKEWADFLNDGPAHLDNVLTQLAGDIEAAALCDAIRWPQYAHADVTTQSGNLRRWMTGSIEWLKQQWGSQGGVFAPEVRTTVVRPGRSCIEVIAATAADITITSIDGRQRSVRVTPGLNTIPTAPGLYIVAHQKLAVR